MNRPTQISLRTLALAALLVALARPAAAGIARFTAFGPPNGQVFAAASLPDRPGSLLLSTELGGLFRSADGGRSWAWSSLGLGGDTLQAIAPDPDRAATLYGASFRAFYRSDDFGQSWQAVATGQRFGSEVEVSLTAAPSRKGQPKTLYLAAGQQLFVSHDLGATWPASRTEGFGVAFRAVAFDPGHPQTAYAVASGNGGGLLRSTDTGYTWTHIGPALFSQGLTGFAFVPTDPAVLLASASGRFFRSTTGGASWREVPSGLYLSRLLVDPRSPATVYGVSGGAVKVSTDAGATWRLLGDTLANDIARLVVDRASRTLTAFTRYDVFSLPPRTAAWSLVFRSAAHGTADPDAAAQVHFDPADPATVYTVLGARAFRSTDGGATWQPRGPYPDPGQSILLDADLLADPRDAEILSGTSFSLGALRSTDGGVSFAPIVLTPAVDPLRPAPPRGVVDERLYADPVVPHRVYLAIARRLYVASF